MEKKDLPTRKREFEEYILNSFGLKYEKDLLIQFCEYWTEHNIGGKKMRYEMEKVFNPERRLGTFYRNQQSRIKPGQKKELPKNVYPGSLTKNEITKEDAEFRKAYKEQAEKSKEKKPQSGNLKDMIAVKINQIKP